MYRRLHLGTMIALLAVSLLAGTALAETYEVDASHSQVLFKVKHLGISTVTGSFSDFTGSFELSESDLSTLSARAEISASSIDTRDDDRDKHLKSDDFLAVDRHPIISFVSTKAEVKDENNVELHGELTIRGVTKPVVLDATFGGAVSDPWGGRRAALTATTEINRKDFGVSWNQILDNGGFVVSDTVTIVLEVEGIEMSATD